MSKFGSHGGLQLHVMWFEAEREATRVVDRFLRLSFVSETL